MVLVVVTPTLIVDVFPCASVIAMVAFPPLTAVTVNDAEPAFCMEGVTVATPTLDELARKSPLYPDSLTVSVAVAPKPTSETGDPDALLMTIGESGVIVGTDVGCDVGFDEGAEVGCDVGSEEGADVGFDVGANVGANVGTTLGELPEPPPQPAIASAAITAAIGNAIVRMAITIANDTALQADAVIQFTHTPCGV
jgi:hypothetical protein